VRPTVTVTVTLNFNTSTYASTFTLIAPKLVALGVVFGLVTAVGAGSGCQRSPASSAEPPPPSTECSSSASDATPLRRLTRFELGRSLADVLGVSSALADRLPPDERSQGYDNSATAYSVSALHAMELLAMGESAATAFVADRSRLFAVAGCDPAAAGGAIAAGGDCLEAFIRTLGGRLWRRPIDADELAALVALDEAVATSDPRAGITAVIATLLQSPDFVYRPEPAEPGEPPGPAGGAGPHPAHARATRLAFLVTSSAPDVELLAAAADGSLMTPAVLATETERLMASPRALESFQHWADAWWELDAVPALEKNVSVFRGWNDDLPTAFARETDLFLADAWRTGPTLTALLTGTTTFVDASLAAFYGYPSPTRPGFQPMALASSRASGLLTQASFLAAHAQANQTSPVQRGRFVRARLFCRPPPPPPPNLVITPPTVDPRLSTRQRYQMHSADPGCAGCHRLMDPIGLSFEHFDATGHWRDFDGGMPVDATATLAETDVDGELDGVGSLAGRLVKSDEVRACVATEWFRWAFGRAEATSDDLCTIHTLSSALASAGGDLRSLARTTVTTPLFLGAGSGASP
jgi:hypothetical protein